jgi:hypothetical protein
MARQMASRGYYNLELDMIKTFIALHSGAYLALRSIKVIFYPVLYQSKYLACLLYLDTSTVRNV